MKHINIENDSITIPWYAKHEDGLIAGFFNSFSFLSNFYPVDCGIFLGELCFPSTEHAYQAAKWPVDQRSQFVEITAGKAKALGKLAPDFNAKKWDKNKVSVMASLCRQKFTNSLKLREMLLMTDGCVLEERNSWSDRFWGTDEYGIGENHLGKILMDIRYDLLTKKEMF